MYKLLFLLFFLLVIASFSFVAKQARQPVQISTPVVSGSPILILNQSAL